MRTVLQDARFGLRMWWSSPGFTIAAILCLALGIGATTAIFSVVNAVLLRPLPYAQPQQLVRIYSEFPTFPNGGLRRFWMSPPEYLDLKRDTRSWQSIDGWVTSGANLAGEAQPVRVTDAFVTGSMLSTLGVQPALGRLISPDDDKPDAPLVANISYGVWQSVFGGKADIVGKETQFNGRKITIIGVMPKGFAFPPGELDPPQVWVPLQVDPAKPGGRGSHFLSIVGRLKSGVSAQQAQSELQSLVQEQGTHRAPNVHVFHPQFHTIVSFPLQAEVVANVRPALLTLLGAVAFVLLIACVNVANLLLARAEARRREIAIRGALGAGMARLSRQFATEGVLLSLIGAVFGLALAFGGLRVIEMTHAGALPRAAEIGIDWRVLLFTLGLSFLTGVLFGLAPMASLFLGGIGESLKETGTSTTGSAGAQAFRRALVSGELALALVLLVGCGLMIRAFWKLQHVNVGLDPQQVMTMSVSLPAGSYPKPENRDAMFRRIEERLGSLPGVESAALVSGMAPIRRPNMNDTGIEGFVTREGGPIQNIDYYQAVSKDYFKTMKIRLIAGRFFDASDGPQSPCSVIVNQTMALRFWPGQDPIGRRVSPGDTQPKEDKSWCRVVGVVDDVKNAGIEQPTGTELYFPYDQPAGSGQGTMYIVVRSKGDLQSIPAEVRQVVQGLDPSLPLANVRTMDDVVSAAQDRPRFLALLLTMFSIVALAIATVGIYGVISYSVARRTKEFGLRLVLGASSGDVLGLVLKQGMWLVLIGIGAGVAVSLALTRLMAKVLFEVAPTDPVTFISVPLVLAAVAMVACYVPARRATRVDPMRTLRYE